MTGPFRRAAPLGLISTLVLGLAEQVPYVLALLVRPRVATWLCMLHLLFETLITIPLPMITAAVASALLTVGLLIPADYPGLLAPVLSVMIAALVRVSRTAPLVQVRLWPIAL